MKYPSLCLLLVGASVAAISCGSGDSPEPVQAAGAQYTVTVRAADPIEVRVVSGTAETVTLAAVMPAMGHAVPPMGTERTGPDRFVATGNLLTMDGEWELSISLSGDRGMETITVDLPV
ncbi:hypothetical protein [Nocardia sp. NPDC050793]|uniref:hypothetical protein n=1 Tax=Nocardia sp. NPDC050793 TaxID=3155159 RepID=UPI003410F4F6